MGERNKMMEIVDGFIGWVAERKGWRRFMMVLWASAALTSATFVTIFAVIMLLDKYPGLYLVGAIMFLTGLLMAAIYAMVETHEKY